MDFWGKAMRNRVLYHPALVRRYTAAMLHEARRLKKLREDIELEAQQMREEMHQMKAEFRRLRWIDAAQRAERDPNAALN